MLLGFVLKQCRNQFTRRKGKKAIFFLPKKMNAISRVKLHFQKIMGKQTNNVSKITSLDFFEQNNEMKGSHEILNFGYVI
jgi:hypothetical protein